MDISQYDVIVVGGMLLADAGEQFEAVDRFGADFGEDEVDVGLLEYLERLVRIVTTQDTQVLGREVAGRPLEDVEVVIDDHDRAFWRSFGHADSGWLIV